MAVKKVQKKELIKTFRNIGWLLLVFLILMLIVSAVERKQSKNATAIVTDIRPLPDGNSMINEGNIYKTLDKSFVYKLTGVPIGDVDVERVERVLEEDPFILDAEVYLDAQNNINIGVDQREPIIRIIDKNGVNYYLDKDANKMPMSDNFTARVIVATGNIPPHVPNFQQKKAHTLKDLFALTHLLLADEFYHSLIEQIYISNNGEYTLIPKVGNQKIQLGKYEKIEDKLWRLKVFYEEGMPYEGWNKYKDLDVRFAGQVIGRK